MTTVVVRANRLALGTAQFGSHYGIANERGQVRKDEAKRILATARRKGLDLLDTAVVYGDSESQLGAVGVSGWRTVTKLPECPVGALGVAAWTRQQVRDSLNRLRVNRLYGLLLHRPSQLLTSSGDALYAALADAKNCGLVEKIGLSVYAPEELTELHGRFVFDLVQTPLNILDQRIIDSGWLRRLHHQGVEIHARSAFLQGLLVMAAARRPEYFARWHPLWKTWGEWLESHRLTALQACIRYPLNFPEIAAVVVGVESESQLSEIIMAADGDLPALPTALKTNDINLLNPARWG